MGQPAIDSIRIAANGLDFDVAACGDGPRLALCLHGFPECNYSWRHQLPVLARMGYTAWAPNLRGYGSTSRPGRVRDYRMRHLVDDVAGLIDASGADQTLLIGCILLFNNAGHVAMFIANNSPVSEWIGWLGSENCNIRLCLPVFINQAS